MHGSETVADASDRSGTSIKQQQGNKACLCAGILVWSVALMREGRTLAAAALFAVLINMKHLLLCLAPLYLLYLLSRECRCNTCLSSCIAQAFALSDMWMLASSHRQG